MTDSGSLWTQNEVPSGPPPSKPRRLNSGTEASKNKSGCWKPFAFIIYGQILKTLRLSLPPLSRLSLLTTENFCGCVRISEFAFLDVQWPLSIISSTLCTKYFYTERSKGVRQCANTVCFLDSPAQPWSKLTVMGRSQLMGGTSDSFAWVRACRK
jgi:hypothetical protein